jgi:NADPH:quinone reductase-like Zn-dependent oxidoreductase
VRAVVCERYGPPDVLRLADIERPVPRRDQLLVKVHATTVTRTDCEFRQAKPFVSRFVTGLARPKWKVFGYELAGEVAAIGADISEFAVGDEVFGVNAGLRPDSFGAHAEYVCVHRDAPLARKPANVTFEQAAAACDGAILALGCLRPAGVTAGTTILVYGASGSIGTAAVQLATHFGADVTAVCGARSAELVRSIGAQKVIDYEREDFSRNGRLYDVVYDAVGKLSFARCKPSLRPGGHYLTTDGLKNIVLARTSRFGDKTVVFPVPPRYTKDDVAFVAGLIEASSYRAVIDRCYPLEQVVEAARYVETGQKTGNVVLTVIRNPQIST